MTGSHRFPTGSGNRSKDRLDRFPVPFRGTGRSGTGLGEPLERQNSGTGLGESGVKL
jgi:hypothetical protein